MADHTVTFPSRTQHQMEGQRSYLESVLGPLGWDPAVSLWADPSPECVVAAGRSDWSAEGAGPVQHRLDSFCEAFCGGTPRLAFPPALSPPPTPLSPPTTPHHFQLLGHSDAPQQTWSPEVMDLTLPEQDFPPRPRPGPEDLLPWPQMDQAWSPLLHSGAVESFASSGHFSSQERDLTLVPAPWSEQTDPVLTRGPFISLMHRVTSVPHYTPPPMLNPHRPGTGLYRNLLPPRDPCPEQRRSQQNGVNIGRDFQAELPELVRAGENAEREEPEREELVWRPWTPLQEDDTLLQHAESLLDLSASAAVTARGGGASLEFALQCLCRSRGNVLEALEMLLSAENRHCSGGGIWTRSEQRLFREAFTLRGKDFSFIQKTVKTKQVSHCVEFYYRSKRLLERPREERRARNTPCFPAPHESPTSETHQASFTSSFPCKQCGKMFYKIKSRNAHMKIHRQQQDDWREKLQLQQNRSRVLVQTPEQNQSRVLVQTPEQNRSRVLVQTPEQNRSRVLVQTPEQMLQQGPSPQTWSLFYSHGLHPSAPAGWTDQ